MQQDRAVARLPQISAAGNPLADPVHLTHALDNTAKAAIVVRLLLGEGVDLPLEDLPDDLQARLTQQMATMGLIDRGTLAAVVQEFIDALDGVGLSFPKGIAGALSVLDGKISPQTAARLRKEAGVRQAGDPWVRLRALPVEDLAIMAQAESVEVAAVLLSKLETAKAASLLGRFPGPLARAITYAIAQTGSVTPEAVDRIGLSLASQIDLKPMAAFDAEPGERVGAILNLSAAATRDDMLTGLDETDADFAKVVRKSIFTFAHIPTRIEPRDIAKVIRATDPAALVTALAFALADQTEGSSLPASAEHMLANMSGRMADNLREEISEKGPVKLRDGEAAMTDMVAAIRTLEQAGEIAFVVADEDEEDAD